MSGLLGNLVGSVLSGKDPLQALASSMLPQGSNFLALAGEGEAGEGARQASAPGGAAPVQPLFATRGAAKAPMGRQDETLSSASQEIMGRIFGGPVSGAEVEYDVNIPPEVKAKAMEFLGLNTIHEGENVAYVNEPVTQARLGPLGASPEEAVEAVAVQEVTQKVLRDRFEGRMSQTDQETVGALPSLYAAPGPMALHHVNIAATALMGGYPQSFVSQYSGVIANSMASLESTLADAGVIERGDRDETRRMGALIAGALKGPDPVKAVERLIEKEGGDPKVFMERLGLNMTAQFEAAVDPIMDKVGVDFEPRIPTAPAR
jgi:hypothetical protein